ncbi:hypothetical protein AMELA_G00201870, partial [Ameiurus melas]
EIPHIFRGVGKHGKPKHRTIWIIKRISPRHSCILGERKITLRAVTARLSLNSLSLSLLDRGDPGAYRKGHGAQGEGKPWMGCQSIAGHNHTHPHTTDTISLQCMSLDWGRKPKYPEETPKAQGEHADSTHTQGHGKNQTQNRTL